MVAPCSEAQRRGWQQTGTAERAEAPIRARVGTVTHRNRPGMTKGPRRIGRGPRSCRRSARGAAALPVGVELLVVVVGAAEAHDALHAGGDDAPLDQPRGELV